MFDYQYRPALWILSQVGEGVGLINRRCVGSSPTGSTRAVLAHKTVGARLSYCKIAKVSALAPTKYQKSASRLVSKLFVKGALLR